jgi:hypothetical protein
MAINHDAYPFNLAAFADEIAKHTQRIDQQPSDAYAALRDAAIAAFQSNKRVQDLANTYGGWDKSSVVQELPQAWAGDSSDLAFCLMLLLYDHLSDLPLGMHTLWQSCSGLLGRSGWGSTDRELLVRGREFSAFFDAYLVKGEPSQPARAQTRTVFQQVRPASVSGHAGWLDLSDVLSLKNRLDAEEAHIRSKAADPDESEAFQKAQAMLDMAVTKEKGLCLIISG